MEKNKQELIQEAANLAKQHQQKKEIIESILNDLDKKEITKKHTEGIIIVNELLKEMEIIEKKHYDVLEKIKK